MKNVIGEIVYNKKIIPMIKSNYGDEYNNEQYKI